MRPLRYASLLFGVAVWLVAFIGASASGAQDSALTNERNVKLEKLFASLQAATGAEEAAGPIREIWETWLQSGDAEVDRGMQQGILAMNRRRYEVAVEIFGSLTKKAPNFAEAWNKRATVYYLMGRLDESLSDIDRTLELEPRHFGAMSGRALILTAKGDAKGALIAVEEALKANPFLQGARDIIERNGGTFYSREPI